MSIHKISIFNEKSLLLIWNPLHTPHLLCCVFLGAFCHDRFSWKRPSCSAFSLQYSIFIFLFLFSRFLLILAPDWASLVTSMTWKFLRDFLRGLASILSVNFIQTDRCWAQSWVSSRRTEWRNISSIVCVSGLPVLRRRVSPWEKIISKPNKIIFSVEFEKVFEILRLGIKLQDTIERLVLHWFLKNFHFNLRATEPPEITRAMSSTGGMGWVRFGKGDRCDEGRGNILGREDEWSARAETWLWGML